MVSCRSLQSVIMVLSNVLVMHMLLMFDIKMVATTHIESRIRPSLELGVNWGTQASHRLPPKTVMKMLKGNGFTKVKLFEAHPEILSAFVGTDIKVTVGIPNHFLLELAHNQSAANAFVEFNISRFVHPGGVHIQYIAVGNEPLHPSHDGKLNSIILPALVNIQDSLDKAGLGDRIKLTVPMSADAVSGSPPSAGHFRHNIIKPMTEILQFLSKHKSPFTVNIHPFFNYAMNRHHSGPESFTFFKENVNNNTNSSSTTTVVIHDINGRKYTNSLDATFDTVVAALEKLGYKEMQIIVGEIGWPSTGYHSYASIQNAQKFLQGLIYHTQHLNSGGTPARPNKCLKTQDNSQPDEKRCSNVQENVDIYIFALFDEDQKDILPGNFERHWGLFTYDGVVKYPELFPFMVNATQVRYLKREWCVATVSNSSDGDGGSGQALADAVAYACRRSDCSDLGPGSECSKVLGDSRSNASYAFNQYFQKYDQAPRACHFNGLARISSVDPSQGNCRFMVQINSTADIVEYSQPSASSSDAAHSDVLPTQENKPSHVSADASTKSRLGQLCVLTFLTYSMINKM